jgi:hypothetical protein
MTPQAPVCGTYFVLISYLFRKLLFSVTAKDAVGYKKMSDLFRFFRLFRRV